LDILILTSGASALRYFVFDGSIDRTAEATTNFKHSEEVFCECVGLEEYDLAALVDQAWITDVSSHAKTLALIEKGQIDGEQLHNPRYTMVDWGVVASLE
jgi:hypothetical protein